MRRLTSVGRRLMLKSRFAISGVRQAAEAKLRAQRPTLPLEQVQRRLELLLTAMYGRPIPISAAEPRGGTWVERLADFLSRDARKREATPGIDGAGIQLPVSLTARD